MFRQICGVQQSNSVIHKHIATLFSDLSHIVYYRILELDSLCYTVVLVDYLSSSTGAYLLISGPNLFLPTTLSLGNIIFLNL